MVACRRIGLRDVAGSAQISRMSFPARELAALWAPWRVEYFEKKERSPNFMLEASQTTDDAAHLVLHRGKYTFVMMNRYPYATGHLMVVPYRELPDLDDLGDEEVLELWRNAARSQKILRATIKAHGFNVGLNIGSAAGAGFAQHLHLHVVPRWEGDVNFMPVLGETRIIPEGLEALYGKLRAAFDAELEHDVR